MYGKLWLCGPRAGPGTSAECRFWLESTLGSLDASVVTSAWRQFKPCAYLFSRTAQAQRVAPRPAHRGEAPLCAGLLGAVWFQAVLEERYAQIRKGAMFHIEATKIEVSAVTHDVYMAVMQQARPP